MGSKPDVVDVTNQGSVGGFREYIHEAGQAPDFYDVIAIAPNPTGVTGSISLDGVPMRGVVRWSAEVDVHEANKVTVTFYARSINGVSA